MSVAVASAEKGPSRRQSTQQAGGPPAAPPRQPPDRSPTPFLRTASMFAPLQRSGSAKGLPALGREPGDSAAGRPAPGLQRLDSQLSSKLRLRLSALGERPEEEGEEGEGAEGLAALPASPAAPPLSAQWGSAGSEAAGCWKASRPTWA